MSPDPFVFMHIYVVVVCCCSHINSLAKESVVTLRCWNPRKIRKTKKNRKFGGLKIHETKKAHTS